MKNHFYNLALLIGLIACQNNTQDYHFRLCLDGISYDSLFIAGINDIGQAVKIPGMTTDGKDWQFTIPDSIYQSVSFFNFFQKRSAKRDTTYNTIFQTINRSDTLNYYYFVLDKNIKEIHARYIGRKITENTPLFLL